MVASYSPRQKHGGPTAIARARSKSPRRRFFNSPAPCASPFAITRSQISKAARSPALRRLTSHRARSVLSSPIKSPLAMTTSSGLNSNCSSSDNSAPSSPAEKHALHRQNRAATENGIASSPLKREGLFRTGRGSPVAKKRLIHGTGLTTITSPLFGSSSAGNAAGAITPRRNPGLKKTSTHLNRGDKLSFVRSRPQARQAGFMSPADPASKIRRIASIENFLRPAARESPFTINSGPLPNASTHFPNSTSSKPLSVRLSSTVSAQPSAKAAGKMSEDWVTPQNYKFAKPNPAAFHSTGFIPKRGRLNPDTGGSNQPDTPCKKTASFSVSLNGDRKIGSSKLADIPSPLPGTKSNLSKLRRKHSSFGNDDDPTSELFERGSQTGNEYELPPTPTKTVIGTLGSLFGSVVGTKRGRPESRSASPYEFGRSRTRVKPSTPQTPREQMLSSDPSFLPIRGSDHPLETPARTQFSTFDFFKNRSARTPTNLPSDQSPNIQMNLNLKFRGRVAEVKQIGSGEFSDVYLAVQRRSKQTFSSPLSNSYATPGDQLATPRLSSPLSFSSPTVAAYPSIFYAIKRSKTPYAGPKDRSRRLEEVEILRELTKHENVVEYIDHWEEDGRYLCIQTEYCANGSLDRFLDRHGTKGRLDEFRVWKVLLELCLGLKHIHDSGFMHLDLKPANILIAYDGCLKISDFGMAVRYPAPSGIEREGDREYIAPEVIQSQKYDKPVDIFSLGLIVIEVAGNEALPQNGPVWQSLRNGDITMAPVLSTSQAGEFVIRDGEGNPISTETMDGYDSTASTSSLSSHSSSEFDPDFRGSSPRIPRRTRKFYRTQSGQRRLLHNPRPGDLPYPPKFMEEDGLERLVVWMISPDPASRPTVHRLLELNQLRWVNSRRRRPATIFEGLWGPETANEQMDMN